MQKNQKTEELPKSDFAAISHDSDFKAQIYSAWNIPIATNEFRVELSRSIHVASNPKWVLPNPRRAKVAPREKQAVFAPKRDSPAAVKPPGYHYVRLAVARYPRN